MSTAEPAAGATAETPVFRPRKRWRRALNALLGLAIVVALGVGVLRVTSLWGIPDAPEPFDVAAFEAETVPDDRNAAVLFLEARRLIGGPNATWAIWGNRYPGHEWRDSGPDVRRWVADHRPALEVWRRGTERPDAWKARRGTGWSSGFLIDDDLPNWMRTAALEASRLEEAGDLAGAWVWHRARLRAALLVGRRAGLLERRNTSFFFDEAATRARIWADCDGMTTDVLRRAIADVEAMAALHGTEADSLKRTYIEQAAEIDDPGLAFRLFEPPPNGSKVPPIGSPPGRRLPEPFASYYRRADLSLRAEPERSRQINRLIFANWLAQADKGPGGRAKVISTDPLVFDAGPGASLGRPRATSPGSPPAAPLFALVRGGFGAPPPSWPIPDRWPRLFAADRRARANLIVALAVRIYEIETGAVPPDDAMVVGAVLPKFPDDYVPPDGGSDAQAPPPK